MEDDMKTIVIGFDAYNATLAELKEIENEEGYAGLYSEWYDTDNTDYRYDSVSDFFNALNANEVDTENVYWFVIDVPADLA